MGDALDAVDALEEGRAPAAPPGPLALHRSSGHQKRMAAIGRSAQLCRGTAEETEREDWSDWPVVSLSAF